MAHSILVLDIAPIKYLLDPAINERIQAYNIPEEQQPYLLDWVLLEFLKTAISYQVYGHNSYIDFQTQNGIARDEYRCIFEDLKLSYIDLFLGYVNNNGLAALANKTVKTLLAPPSLIIAYNLDLF